MKVFKHHWCMYLLLKIHFQKTRFFMRLPIKAQIRTQKNVKCDHIIKCAKCAQFLPKIKCVLHVRNNYFYTYAIWWRMLLQESCTSWLPPWIRYCTMSCHDATVLLSATLSIVSASASHRLRDQSDADATLCYLRRSPRSLRLTRAVAVMS